MKNFTKKKIIYITNNGVLEALGNSQILSYIYKLAQNYDITLISLEKKEDLQIIDYQILKKKLIQKKINWIPHKYYNYRNPLNYITFFLIFFRVLTLILRGNKLLHIRSFVPGIIIYFCSFLLKIKFIYDSRGFWINEKIDRLNYKNTFILNILKKIDKFLYINSYKNIFLTHEAKNIISKKYTTTKNKNIVITTSSSFSKFEPKKNKNNKKIKFLYLGTTDGAYNFDKILLFIKNIENKNLDFCLDIFSNDNKNRIINKIENFNLSQKNISINSIKNSLISKIIKEYDFLIFYCKNNYSIKASMPTKISEALLSGVPIICNEFNNDIIYYIRSYNIGILTDFKNNNFDNLLCSIKNFKNDKSHLNRCRKVGEKYFSLDSAVNSLSNIYK